MSKNRLHPVEQLAAARHLQVIFSMVLVLLGGGIGGNIVGCSSDSSTTQPTGGLSVSITTPAAGPVSGTVSIVASAQDAERVSFLVDGTEIGTDVSAPYFAEWVSTTVADGTHRITAAAINGSERVEAFVDVVVDNTGGGGGGGEVAVSVAPPSASITVGQTQQFTATVTGTSNTQVTWSVVEGVSFGTVSAGGLYTAPANVPTPATATVRATSIADGTKSASAVVTIQPGGGGGGGGGGPFSEADLSAIRAAYTGGFDTRSFINDANDLAARAFFGASCLNGNQGTATGTLTETAPNSGEFNYSPQPTDRLKVVFGTGASFDFIYDAISGDLGDFNCDEWLGFLKAHSEFRYRVVATGLDITIASAVVPEDGIVSNVSQSVAGSVTLNGEVWTVDASASGTFSFFITESSSSTHDQLHIEVVLVSGSKRAEIAHDFDFKDDFFSSSGDTFITQTDTVQSGGTPDNGATIFLLQNVQYRFSDTNRRDPIYEVEGTLLKNNVAIGTFVVDSASGQVGIQLGTGEIVAL